MSTNDFKRENRYIIIKRKDLIAAPFAALHSFLEHIQALENLLPDRQFVVVESDWPEYELVWQMIEHRMTGSSQATAGEPEILEAHGWAQTHGPAINSFTQEFDVAEEWSMAGHGVVELLNRDHVDEEIDRLRGAHQATATRLQIEIERLRTALKFYADREHYHFESGNWDSVSGEPLNILWCGDEPDFIEDGSVARAALSGTHEEKVEVQPAATDYDGFDNGVDL